MSDFRLQLRRLTPVSYTHLDVYKRQVYGVADWKIQLEHYARTLLRKPGAVQGLSLIHI